MLCCVPSCEVCDLVQHEVSKHRVLNSVQFWCHARRSSVIAKVDRAVSSAAHMSRVSQPCTV
jgi:hypothetical protein